MKLRVLGCSGGVGRKHLHTTALLLDETILIDAGTGVMDLDVDAMAMIDHVFITHSHLDHIAALPLFLDSVVERRRSPVLVYALPDVIDILHKHVFNSLIWPDFSRIPTPEAPFLRLVPIDVGQPVRLGGGTITALPVDHTVPAVGYQLDSGEASLVFSGDTGECPDFWTAVNGIANLRHLIIECAFPNEEERLAVISKHLSPRRLANELAHLQRDCSIHITHLKPGQIELTMHQVVAALPALQPLMLHNNQVFEF